MPLATDAKRKLSHRSAPHVKRAVTKPAKPSPPSPAQKPESITQAPTTAQGNSTEAPRRPAAGKHAPTATGSCRRWTVSLALPGSIIENAQTHELRSYLVGQIARAATIFKVDEVVILSTDGGGRSMHDGPGAPPNRTDGAVFMARLLQYLECPQYLRKHIFPMHPDLRCVGLLNPLDAANHPRVSEECAYREGLVTEREPKPGHGSWVNVGLQKDLQVDRQLPVGTRVTVRMPQLKGKAGVAVSPREPREASGIHWGYSVRIATSLAAIWSDCPFEEGYDLSLGTSQHGEKAWLEPGFELPRFRHLLLVFGGVEGLEPLVAADPDLADWGADASAMFDKYLNLCPDQGSRTIRTEEALLVGFSVLRTHIARAGSMS